MSVSVVIPAYNYGDYLGKAIDSVLVQDFPGLELIVVDDGSTDNTAEVARSYGSRLRYIHKENAGLSAARNTGIEAATQPFVLFLDADDLLLPGMVRSLMARFGELDDEFAAVACYHDYIDTDGKALEHRRYAPIRSMSLCQWDILMRSRFNPSAAIIRASVFDEVGGFDTTLKSSEDRDMWLRITKRHRIELLGETLVHVRRHERNMSNNADRMYRNMRTSIGKALAEGSYGILSLRVRAFCLYQYAWLLAGEGRPMAALLRLYASSCLWPWYGQPQNLDCPSLFRLRAMKHCLLKLLGVAA